jgi:hypothetical protein
VPKASPAGLVGVLEGRLSAVNPYDLEDVRVRRALRRPGHPHDTTRDGFLVPPG